MHMPDSFFSNKGDEQFRSFVQNLLDTVERQSVQIEKQQAQIEQLLEENEQLRAEIRHLKKQKGKPKIRPNVPDDKGDQEAEAPEAGQTDQHSESSDKGTPPKSKRPRDHNSLEKLRHHLLLHTTRKFSGFLTFKKVGVLRAMPTSTILNSTFSSLQLCTAVSTTRRRKVLLKPLYRSTLKGVLATI